MSYLTSDLPSTILFVAIGVIIGAALSKILNKGPNVTELQQKLEDTQSQFDKYQRDVGTHFQETAELVNQMTESYRQVHEHLSVGAQKLALKTSDTLTSTQFKALSEDSEDSEDSRGAEDSAGDNPEQENETVEAGAKEEQESETTEVEKS